MNPKNPRTASRYLAGLQQMLVTEGVSDAALLGNTGIDQSRLDDPNAWLSLEETDHLLANALRLGSDPMPGLRLGRRLNLSAHGSAGLAGLTAANARQALDVAVRYFPLITETIRLSVVENAEAAEITVTAADNLPTRCHDFVIQTLISSISLMAGFLLGEHAGGLSLRLAEPANEQWLAGLPELQQSTQLGSDSWQIRIPATVLDIPFALADSTAHAQAVARCEAELEAMQRNDSLADRLFQQMLGGDEPPSLEDLAASMHVSSRTLHRRLAAEGKSFRELQSTARIARAEVLLKQGISITEIAHRLGYGDAANFTRAFRRHKGVPPSRYQGS